MARSKYQCPYQNTNAPFKIPKFWYYERWYYERWYFDSDPQYLWMFSCETVKSCDTWPFTFLENTLSKVLTLETVLLDFLRRGISLYYTLL